MEIVRAALDAYNRRDWDALLEDAAPDFECDFSRATGPDRGVYRRDQMHAFLDRFVGTWESVRMEPQEFIEVGEHVVVPVILHAAGRGGIEVQARNPWIYTIRDGAIERACIYQQREEALEAAGLTEQDASVNT